MIKNDIRKFILVCIYFFALFILIVNFLLEYDNRPFNKNLNVIVFVKILVIPFYSYIEFWKKLQVSNSKIF